MSICRNPSSIAASIIIRLTTQIDRWQSNTGQFWSKEQIIDVAKYLNQNFYKLPAPEDERAIQVPPRMALPLSKLTLR
jgi:hypothetical protein